MVLGISPDTILSTVGLTVCLYALYRTLLCLAHILKTFCLTPDLKEYGAWAIVTGGTDGIGKALAVELAKQKINVVLISRNSEKLTMVANEIKSRYTVEIKVDAVDMSCTSLQTYQDLYQKYKDLDIGVIINNVGMSYDHPDYLGDCDDEMLWNMMHINIVPATMLTKVFLPLMAEKKKGLVVNVSSASSLVKAPLLSVYSATKSYVQVLAECLGKEYSGLGVRFQSLNPLFVKTNLTGGIKESISVPSAEKYACHAIKTLGKTDVTTGYWAHSLMLGLLHLLPAFLLDSHVISPLKRGRARWYRKQGEKKE